MKLHFLASLQAPLYSWGIHNSYPQRTYDKKYTHAYKYTLKNYHGVRFWLTWKHISHTSIPCYGNIELDLGKVYKGV